MVLLKQSSSFIAILLLGISSAFAQQTGNINANAMINISDNNSDNQIQINKTNVSNINLYVDNNNNPVQQQQFTPQQQAVEINNDNTIEPTLDNGFHIRFQLNSPALAEHVNKSFNNNYKTKRIKTTFAKRNFIRKRRFKKLFSYNKKNYKTSLCGRF